MAPAGTYSFRTIGSVPQRDMTTSGQSLQVAGRFRTGIEKQIKHRNRVFKVAMKLRIFRISPIAHPFRRYPCGAEQRLVEVTARGRAAKIVIGTGRLDDPQQPFGLGTSGRIIRVMRHARLETQQRADTVQENKIHVGKESLLFREFVPAPYRRRERLEEGGALVRQLKSTPMLVRPRLFDLNLVDRLLKAPLGNDGNGEPLDAVGGPDPIAIVPMPPDILHAVEDHVLVALSDQVKKALPGYVAGLDDADAHVGSRVPSG